MKIKRALWILPALTVFYGCATGPQEREPGFTSIFDGQTLSGWTLVGKKGPGYLVKDGAILCPENGGGNLYTDREYADFILRLEFKLKDGSNNGIGIRAPLDGDAAYMGMEIQVLDDYSDKYKNLRPSQYHGSIYDVVAAEKGALKPAGQWNEEEISCIGRQVKITLNGKVIVNTNLNKITDGAVLHKHPGLLRERGHIGFLGHDAYVEYRNIRIRDLKPYTSVGSPLDRPNSPPPGFISLFNGTDLKGWKGLVADPPKRAKMSADQLAREQAKADENMRAHWKVENGTLVFSGKGQNLVTARDYGNFELLVDWKIMEKGDSGIYLRGTPQVQIWDQNDEKGNPKRLGSGGLYNNQKNPSGPLKRADHFIGEWNRFRILMTGEKVTIFLNNELVVHNTTLENYWERDKPLYATGPIELQNHGNTLYFRNIYLRELP